MLDVHMSRQMRTCLWVCVGRVRVAKLTYVFYLGVMCTKPQTCAPVQQLNQQREAAAVIRNTWCVAVIQAAFTTPLTSPAHPLAPLPLCWCCCVCVVVHAGGCQFGGCPVC